MFYCKNCHSKVDILLVFEKDFCIRKDYKIEEDCIKAEDAEFFSGEIEKITFKCINCGWKAVSKKDTNYINEFMYLNLDSNKIPKYRFTQKEYGCLQFKEE